MRDDERQFDRLRLLDDGPEPDAMFVNRLHDLLAGELGFIDAPASALRRAPGPDGGLTWPGRRSTGARRVAWMLLAAALALLAALGAILAAGSLFQPKPAIVTYRPTLEATTCPRFSSSATTCWFLVVPENRANPNGRTIRVFLARIASRAATPVPDPLAVIEGPLELESNWISSLLVNNPALDRRDVVWIGHRGSGSSQPSLSCPEIDAAVLARLGQAESSSEAASAWKAAVSACHDRLVAEGVELSAYGADESAADVADARTLLGYTSWNLESYSLPAVVQIAMRDYPTGIRSVVLDSPVPLDGDRFGDALANLGASLQTLQRACDSSPTCGSRHSDLEAALRRQAQTYEDAPAEVDLIAPDGSPVRVRIDGARRWEIARLELADNGRIAALPDEFSSGRSAALDAAVADYALSRTIPAGPVSYGAYLSLVCRDEAPFVNQTAIGAGAAGRPGDGLMLPAPPELEACDAWGVNAADPSERRVSPSSIPTIVFVGDMDPLTGPRAAARVALQLSAATLVEAAGATNRLFATPLADCARAIRGSFLDAPTALPDSSCLPSARDIFP
jgi:TAP-like protein